MIPKWVRFLKSAEKYSFGEYFTNLFKVLDFSRNFFFNHKFEKKTKNYTKYSFLDRFTKNYPILE